MEEFKKIYQELKKLGLVNSQYDFSRNWLGQSNSYYSVIKSRNDQLSASALLTLYVKLDDIHDGLQSTQSAKVLKDKISIIENTCQRVWDEMRKQALN